jgi:sugar phosphate isomerase/epimerase
MKLTRREMVLGAGGSLWAAAASDRLGIVCPSSASEVETRKALAAARTAGFRSVQVGAPWANVNAAYWTSLPSWVESEGLRVEALGAYVNCCHPESVIMGCRREDFPTVLELAARMRTRRVVAWTGGYGKGSRDFVPANLTTAAEDDACRFIEGHVKRLEQHGLTLALETLYTMMCPDGASLARLLRRLPACVGAVLDIASMIPVARYNERDQVLRETVSVLKNRVAMVHLKDLRLRPDGKHYDFPGPMDGELNYGLCASQLKLLPPDVPFLAEHLKLDEFPAARRRLLALLAAEA